MIIRTEKSQDIERIRSITTVAHTSANHDGRAEADIVDRLREDGALALSLVAELGPEVVGHVAFSLIKIDGQQGQWFALGPISTVPDLQGQGIGTALIAKGMDGLTSLSAEGCVLLGAPAYYSRFGFTSDPSLTYHGRPTPYLQRIVLKGKAPHGDVAFHPAFEVK